MTRRAPLISSFRLHPSFLLFQSREISAYGQRLVRPLSRLPGLSIYAPHYFDRKAAVDLARLRPRSGAEIAHSRVWGSAIELIRTSADFSWEGDVGCRSNPPFAIGLD